MSSQIDIKEISEAYTKYVSDKRELEVRILENERWYEGKAKIGDIQPPKHQSNFIFSAITNKHADAMDNYPQINVLPREQGDEEEAKTLTEILPVILERGGFKKTYSKCWWYKLKHGAAVYGVFWNPALEGGKGDIEIRSIDFLNLAWQYEVEDIQDSKYVFYTYYMDRDAFISRYGEPEGVSSALEITTYNGDTIGQDQIAVVDCYYKEDGKVKMLKFSGSRELESMGESPIYDHGLYPFFVDALYPKAGRIHGIGVVDAVKGIQNTINLFDDIIVQNSMLVGKTRWFIKDNGGINEEEFLNYNNPLIHAAASVDEMTLRQIQTAGLSSQFFNHRQQKIEELKEIIGNRDFSQGATSGGVTAASAITALQETGNKLSRDMISMSYEIYRDIISCCIELIRQFYDETRIFRITGEGGSYSFVAYDNRRLKGTPPEGAAYMGQEIGAGLDSGDQDAAIYPEEGAAGSVEASMQVGPDAAGSMYAAAFRRPEFDLELSVQRDSPYSKQSQNSTILQLWNGGFFNPQVADVSMIALKQMNFDGKDEIINSLEEYTRQQEAMAQMAQQQQMAAQQMTQQSAGGDEIVEVPLSGEGEDELVEVP